MKSTLERSLLLTDPRYTPREQPGGFDSFALKLINDPRDLPFIKLILTISLTVIPFAISFFIPGWFTWWLALPYLALVLGYFLGPYILMLHNTSHRALFKPQYRAFRFYIPWFLGPFFGESPDTYYVHHIGMHHPENNLEDDLSCTMRFQRDSIVDFARYFLRFFIAIVPELTLYLVRRKRYRLLRQVLTGELTYYIVIALLLFLNWQATLVVLVIPLVVARFAMMTGNWAQHAFIDHEQPENCFRNSITCINSTYNRRCFNDGYHIGHHLKANRHWTDMPAEFEMNMHRYAEEKAVIFEGLDYFLVWLFLMMKRYDLLAKHYVDLSGENRSKEEIMAMLRSRTQRIEAA